MWNCMLNDRSPYSKLSYSNAPIKSLPPYDKSLLPISATTSICDPSVERLRVLVIVNVPWKPDTRMAIRETFANFSAIKHLPTKWTKMFLVGAPRNESESKILELENQKYGDIVVVNITEDYYNLTLKMLIAYKFVSCFCTNAEYFIKSDDDNYIKMEALDREISKIQVSADVDRNIAQIKLQKHRPIFLGRDAPKKVLRHPNKSKWVVWWNEYAEKTYPDYFIGALLVFSMSLIHEAALDCPYLCTGLDPHRYAETRERPCFWKFEDAFIGSCIGFTQKDINVESRPYMKLTSWKGLEKLTQQWVQMETKPVFVSELTQSQHFYEIHKLFNHRETPTTDHPVDAVLSYIFGT